MLIPPHFYLNEDLSDARPLKNLISTIGNIERSFHKISHTVVSVYPVRVFDAGRKLDFRRGREARCLVTTAMCLRDALVPNAWRNCMIEKRNAHISR